MPLDANGIWQYQESETDVSPFSTFLNKLAGSVSAAIAPMVQPGPTPWTSAGVSAGSSQSLSTVQYMVDRWGEVSWRGEIYGGAAPATNGILLNLPAAIAPSYRGVLPLTGLGGSCAVYFGSFGGTGANNEVRFRYLISGAWPSTATTGISLAGLHWRL